MGLHVAILFVGSVAVDGHLKCWVRANKEDAILAANKVKGNNKSYKIYYGTVHEEATVVPTIEFTQIDDKSLRRIKKREVEPEFDDSPEDEDDL